MHKAAVYSLCIFVADTAAHYLFPVWGTFKNRHVGKQWLIWTMGLFVGFILQRTMVSGLIIHYAPEVISYFIANPEARLGDFELLVYLTPYWCLVVFITIRIARSKQRIQNQARSLMVLPSGKKPFYKPSMVNQPEAGKKLIPEGSLNWKNENGGVSIALADITHITVEDHYCRVNYTTDKGLKYKMIRLSLKEMLFKLPQDHFIKIHRSHIVNTAHVSRLRKKGRDHMVVMRIANVDLPVSRSRFKNLALHLSR
jgi:DNA-binding LytR/AlgR family response regulator